MEKSKKFQMVTVQSLCNYYSKFEKILEIAKIDKITKI